MGPFFVSLAIVVAFFLVIAFGAIGIRLFEEWIEERKYRRKQLMDERERQANLPLPFRCPEVGSTSCQLRGCTALGYCVLQEESKNKVSYE